jgi:hypothetical protein
VSETTSRANPLTYKKDDKKKNRLAMDSRNHVEINSNVDENISCTSMWKEVNYIILHHKGEKDMTRLFHIKI